jgi:flotillin
MATYKIAAPDEYLAITGMGIKTLRITKAAWVFPFQRVMRFSVQPHDYAMNLQAMTKEKLQFLLPVVFTVGPDVSQIDSGQKKGPATVGGADENGTVGVQGAVAHGAAVEDQAGAAHGSGDSDVYDYHSYRPSAGGDALVKYAMLLADSGNKQRNNHQFVENIVKGIIEGEVRVLVSAFTMEEIFSERELFKRRIFRNIQGELSQFG